MTFCVWLLSLIVIFFSLIHIVVCISTLFVLMAENIPLSGYHFVFIHLSLDEHLGFFHFLAIVNSAAVMNVSA